MTKILFTVGLVSILCASLVSADALKNSLNSILNKKDSTGMVNLSGVSVGAKPKPKMVSKLRKSRSGSTVIGRYNDGKVVYKKEADLYIKKATKGKIKDLDLLPKKQRLLVLKDLQRIYTLKHFKSRPGQTVVATVNEREINKEELDNFLNLVTKGKVKDFDSLDIKQRLLLVKDFARPNLIQEAIKEEISQEEKDAIFRQIWLDKEKANIQVTNDEMLALYEAKKAKAIANNPQAQIPPYISLGNVLKNEIIEKKMMSRLMKDVNITVSDERNETLISNDLKKSLGKLDKISDTKEMK